MPNLYPINTIEQVQAFADAYVPLVLHQLKLFQIDLAEFGIKGDHLGLQVLSAEEFDNAHALIATYAQTIRQGEVHNRRNNTYKFNEVITSHGLELQSIEIFEPKPDAIIEKLKAGFEHIALYVQEYDALLNFSQQFELPVGKSLDFNGSRAFKSKFLNLVEIEFREDYLWKCLQK